MSATLLTDTLFTANHGGGPRNAQVLSIVRGQRGGPIFICSSFIRGRGPGAGGAEKKQDAKGKDWSKETPENCYIYPDTGRNRHQQEVPYKFRHYQCPNCNDDALYFHLAMKEHSQEEHGGLRESCQKCHIRFKTKKELIDHRGKCPMRKIP